MSFYRRRPNILNICGCNDDEDESLAEFENRFCKRCGYELIWREDIEAFFCCKCGWQRKKEKPEKVVMEEEGQGKASSSW